MYNNKGKRDILIFPKFDNMNLIQKVRNKYDRLSNLVAPHITLAYYNCNGFDASSARKLEKIIRRLNDNTFEIILDTKRLYYQKFTSMNDYINILNLSD